MEILWWGSHRRKAFSDEGIAARDRLADAARAGEWDVVLELAERHRSVNAVRVGGNSGFAPLHQAAWLGAPETVVERLIELGAWRTLRTADGDTAADIADARGNDHLSALLAPQLVREVDATVLAQLECQLHAVILGRVLELCRESGFRAPSLSPLLEYSGATMWAAIPGFYGGFAIELAVDADELDVSSWCRVAGGSGQRHRIRPDGFELVEEGFV
ncbi:ankyrin repeat domain-containing protein [Nocardia sp. NPDC050717]|uniref:ankyrin repeat domain-containing protein n=1 Tax=Nocardia sp. NPDC050717 TaxID=3157221 RepID=UPI0034024D78